MLGYADLELQYLLIFQVHDAATSRDVDQTSTWVCWCAAL